MSQDEKDITSLTYVMMLVELGYRVTRAMIYQNVEVEP